MILTTIKPTSQHVQLSVDVPLEYVGMDVQVLLFIEGNKQAQSSSSGHPSLRDLAGSLSAENYTALKNHTEQARKEWDRNF